MQPAAEHASARPARMWVQHARRAAPLSLSPPAFNAGSSSRTHHHYTHHRPPPYREYYRENPLPPRSSCAQARTRATDADLRRSGELVDEPGSGAGPRRAYPSLHHGGPASMCLSIWCPGPSHHSLASWGADSACCWLPLRGCVLGRVGGHENKSLIRGFQHAGQSNMEGYGFAAWSKSARSVETGVCSSPAHVGSSPPPAPSRDAPGAAMSG